MPFPHLRTIRFSDTDAAGVVYFANVLSICHEAYEASLAAAGLELAAFFRGESVAVPIVHAEIRFMQPMVCGQTYAIAVMPNRLSPEKFQIDYMIRGPLKTTTEPNTLPLVSQAATVHLCIDPATRERTPLPAQLEHWLATIPSNPDIPAS